MKALKKAWINTEGFFDFFRSRYNGIGEMIGGGVGGAAIGFFFGGMVGLIYSEEASDKEAFINENIEPESVYLQVDFPSSCDIDDGFAYVAKGPNGKHTLYIDGEPQTERNSKRFVEDVEDCIADMKDDPSMLETTTIRLRYNVSQPMRTVDLNDEDATENFRVTRSSDDSEEMSLVEWDKQLAEHKDGAIGALQSLWKGALADFEDGDIYNHIEAKDVTTLEYKDDYAPYYWSIPLYAAAGLGAFGFFGAGFGRMPDSEARARKENRAARRRALDSKPLDF
ncbi:MAG: hypothetical protein CL561_03730 [Alphaproteobacteria bacterium]|nr:hypothetical protein [Alphaproteobacteria bacterium]|tara:strand:- start:533553 stop:534398 length:846 start_codon:yes stop_codon:yes gene_type:complete